MPDPEIRVFEVGGTIRDGFLDLENKDLDFAVEAPSWDVFQQWAHDQMDEVYLERPEFFAIRGKLQGVPADFTMCRKDGFYSDGRHPDEVEIGTIYDDLARRDFTCNAMARSLETNELLDPHGGRQDIRDRILRTVGPAQERFEEDGLRVIRAIRFSITKDLHLHDDINEFLISPRSLEVLEGVSTDRIREELAKCFKHSPQDTIYMIECHLYFDTVTEIFDGRGIWLEPTTKKR